MRMFLFSERHSQPLHIVELLKSHFVHGGGNPGSRHVVGKCTVWCPIWYRQLVAENVNTGESGAALVFSMNGHCFDLKSFVIIL